MPSLSTDSAKAQGSMIKHTTAKPSSLDGAQAYASTAQNYYVPLAKLNAQQPVSLELLCGLGGRKALSVDPDHRSGNFSPPLKALVHATHNFDGQHLAHLQDSISRAWAAAARWVLLTFKHSSLATSRLTCARGDVPPSTIDSEGLVITELICMHCICRLNWPVLAGRSRQSTKTMDVRFACASGVCFLY